MNSDLGNGSFGVEIRDSKLVDRCTCSWRSTRVRIHEFDHINWPLLILVYLWLDLHTQNERFSPAFVPVLFLHVLLFVYTLELNIYSYSFLHTDMHSPLDSNPHIFGCMHPPVHRCTCYYQHICMHTRSHAPSIPQQAFCCVLCLSLLVVISLCSLLYVLNYSWTVKKKVKWHLTSNDVYVFEMLAMVASESSFGAYVCHRLRRPSGLHRD